jgi:aromatic-L-amino-acid decarboxylase
MALTDVRPSTEATSPEPNTPDMTAAEFKRYGYQVVDWIANYLDHVGELPVLSQISPGQIKRSQPDHAPLHGESMDQLLADVDRVVLPGMTHWNHPAFFAYFAISGSAPGILGEMLAAAFNVNAMMWRTSPAATELEEVTLVWLRRLIGLPDDFGGVIYDTASISSLVAIAAAREAVPGLRVREEGLAAPARAASSTAGLPDRVDAAAAPANSKGSAGAPPRLRLYCSEHTHSSIDKAAITLGLGQAGLRRIPADAEFRMDPALLAQAIKEDRAAGWLPFCVVATVGTTSTTSIDPVAAVADICQREALWLHVDAAYGGSAAAVPEMRWVLDGAERADSIVVNPHKWMFVPVDLSVLFCRRMDVLGRAFSLTPEYLRAPGADEVANFMDYGPQLGRRFRAIKLWFVLRYYGAEGLAERIRNHIRLAKEFAAWVDSSPEFERMAPTPLSTVCFRARPRDLGYQSQVYADSPRESESYLETLNEALMASVNRGGKVFLSHTKLNGKYTLRLAIGNIRTTRLHVELAWDLLVSEARRLDQLMRPAELKSEV